MVHRHRSYKRSEEWRKKLLDKAELTLIGGAKDGRSTDIQELIDRH